MECDTWWGLNILSQFQLSALTAWDRQCLEDSERKVQQLNYSVNELQTAPAAPGLLNIYILFRKSKYKNL